MPAEHPDNTLDDTRFWQDDGADKSLEDLAARLEARARTGNPMQKFALRRCQLPGINLVNAHSKSGFKLTHSDLYRADLRKGHFFNVDFSGSSLMKANLEGANLHCANLSDCNLLGVNLEKCKLENVTWGSELIQEKQARATRNIAEKHEYYQQAEEIYRHLRKVTESEGLFEQAGTFFQKEMVMRRYQMPRYSSQRIISRMVEIFCGYGEQPLRVILFSIIAIIFFAVLYLLTGITESDHLLRLNFDNSFQDNISQLLKCLYFSVVTFTTLGYGDLAPTGWARGIAATEAFIGSFTLALFVVVFVKKMTR
ncbi:MAG: pentapeptide repeat-containing protein [Pseudomonadales bacterium]|uniref:Potassium channel domain-containing protein n=1 Tax=Oleiphilus messinensis TaxID=141451 RepID=A0A1Y0IA39_9GAMM|nr:pentapeptide repeat-containing protein [Oleiphilus messinensis]ARU57331.1 hypothetical protein OLMES_3290 [Oleiphilus messinensis]MCG8610186.1 pentapeptide repeat-containing protein [Pseudomonadales bacterium]